MAWTAFIDGGARGNPGPAAAGVQILDEAGQPVFAGGLFLGHKTNNDAEYAGLLLALDLLHAAGATDIRIHSDSELLVRQMQGKYRVKAENLRPLYEDAKDKSRDFASCKFDAIPRERNTQADGLVNKALDVASDVIALDPLKLAASLNRPAVAPRPNAPTRNPTAAPRANAVFVTVIRGSNACPARTKAGEVHRFADTIPGGLCIEGCAAVIEAVISVRAMRTESEPVAPMQITCQHPGCGAVFEIK